MNRLAAERLGDGARAVFGADYLREHVSLGYAVTIHSAQGVTADKTHAVLGDGATRSLLYVAVTRGRDTNSVYFYQRTLSGGASPAGEDRYPSTRGTRGDGAAVAHDILARDDRPLTAHHTASTARGAALPRALVRLIDQRSVTVSKRRETHTAWRQAAETLKADLLGARARNLSRALGLSAD